MAQRDGEGRLPGGGEQREGKLLELRLQFVERGGGATRKEDSEREGERLVFHLVPAFLVLTARQA
jgi:hypothetical protein